jgi:hypothetical protein
MRPHHFDLTRRGGTSQDNGVILQLTAAVAAGKMGDRRGVPVAPLGRGYRSIMFVAVPQGEPVDA